MAESRGSEPDRSLSNISVAVLAQSEKKHTTIGGTCSIKASSNRSMKGVNTSVEMTGKSAARA